MLAPHVPAPAPPASVGPTAPPSGRTEQAAGQMPSKANGNISASQAPKSDGGGIRGEASGILPSPSASPTPIPVTVAAPGARGYLEPISHEYETWNNCAPVTTEMVLSYYGISKRQTEIAPVLKPNPKNFSVRIEQIAAYAAQFGLQSNPLVGGSLKLLKTFVSNGIPVVVEDQLSLQDDYGHFRVVRGFDDGAGVIIFGDSYFGPANRLPYNLYQELWKRHNYTFMPVYRPESAPLVQAILGRDTDPRQNDEDAAMASKEELAARPTDGFEWLNLGADLFRLGRFEDALAAWDHAKQLKLTPRTLWYTIWPAAAYNHVGQFQQAIDVTAIPLATDPNDAEALLERGNAYRGLGNKERARADYQLAFDIDPWLAPAKQALASL